MGCRACCEELSMSRVDLDPFPQVFSQAHTPYGWLEKPVDPDLIDQAIRLAMLPPTAFNQQPLKLLLIRSAEAKARLSPALSNANRPKTLAAPVTAIVCHDTDFWKDMAEVWPHSDVRPFFEGNPDAAEESSQRNGSLQAGYLILALRSLGLGVGPMSGFNKAMVQEEFLSGSPLRVNFLMNIGWPDPASFRARNPRRTPDQIATWL